MKQTQVVEEYCNTWRWSKHEEFLVSKWIVGNSLHVCCGMSKLGDKRFDISEQTKPDILGDILNNTQRTNTNSKCTKGLQAIQDGKMAI